MKTVLTTLVAVGCFCVAGAALAGPGGSTCATAEQIFPSSNYSGDTSTGSNPLNTFGPVSSPANDAIYYFVANNVATSETIDANFSYDGFIALTAGCNDGTGDAAPYIGGNGGTGNISLSLSTPGALSNGTTYYVIISGNPTGGSGNNGAFSFTTPSPLPVKLQKFSVK